ncbi:glycosyltransferase family 2 protein [uncultured Paracoccus sp.]|uniref:glycosyltransferase family 2 protein n=1 Tax=uncultured Paracoccus sp. TaxID=189685 RepID=UPI00260A30E1|nr:glycosyltransferase family 2 protein [uncultured Paracoccus sp.]
MVTPIAPAAVAPRPASVSVLVTAYNAAATIGDAVRTALAEPEVAEVIVVDDASQDATLAAARASAPDDPRLKLIRCPQNGGPAAARNRALDEATGRFVAILDADDFVMAGRFARLLAVPDWDMVADNILFVPESADPDHLPPVPAVSHADVIDLDLVDFVRANRSARTGPRDEWGFLKPVIRRDMLQRLDLRYDPGLRLGEDYDLYVRLLQQGARFRVSPQVGYAARWRDNSLSASHRTEDLAALTRAATAHLAAAGLSGAARTALVAHRRDLQNRFLLRDFLDRRGRRGRIGAVLDTFRRPTTLLPIARGILRDKLAARRSHAPATRIGHLLIER